MWSGVGACLAIACIGISKRGVFCRKCHPFQHKSIGVFIRIIVFNSNGYTACAGSRRAERDGKRHQVDVFQGLKPEGYVLINSARSFDELGVGEFVQRFRRERLVNVPAGEIARAHLGRPLPNAALLGGFAAISGLITLDAVAKAIRDKFAGKVADANIAAAAEAFDYVARELKEMAHAAAD